MKVTVALKGSGLTRDPVRLMSEWSERMRKFRSQFVYLVSEYAREEVVSRIPSGKQYDAYRDSLERVRVVVGPKYDAFTIRSNPKARKITKTDRRSTLLYIKPRQRGRATPPEILILESYSPWTVDLLPFKPDPKLATMVSRKVSRKQTVQAAENLKRTRVIWAKQLEKLHIRVPRVTPALANTKGLEKVPDAALDALQLEFGLGAEKAHAHWKPAILWLQRRGIRRMMKLRSRDIKELQYSLIKSNFKKWARWPKRIKKIGLPEAKKFVRFQKRLKVHALR